MEQAKKVGRPRKEGRVKKQMFLNEEIVEALKGYSADEINAILGTVLKPKNVLNGLETSPNLPQIEVRYQPTKFLKKEISSSKVAYELLRDVWSDKLEWIEEFVLVPVNTANEPLGYIKLFQGGLDKMIVDSRVVFQIALVASASGIIISHNHPSGSTKPSKNDIDITKNLDHLGKILGIPLLDHIIISPHGYYSFKDEGLIY